MINIEFELQILSDYLGFHRIYNGVAERSIDSRDRVTNILFIQIRLSQYQCSLVHKNKNHV